MELLNAPSQEITPPPKVLWVQTNVPRKALIWDLFLFLAWCGVLLIACKLTPDPRGYATHTQLGFAPCTWRTLYGRPCPSCGLTTAFAHLVRGEWRQAIRSHPLSPFVFAYFTAAALLSGAKFVFRFRLLIPKNLVALTHASALVIFVLFGLWRAYGPQ
jgi:hypothetical protein